MKTQVQYLIELLKFISNLCHYSQDKPQLGCVLNVTKLELSYKG